MSPAFQAEKREEFARAVTEGPVRRCQWLEPFTHFAVRRGVHKQEAGAHRRQILHDLSGALVGGDLVICFDRGPFVGPRNFGGLAQTRQPAIAGAAIGGEFGEGGLSLLMLARFGKDHRALESGAGLARLLGLPPLIAAPCADAATMRMHAAMTKLP